MHDDQGKLRTFDLEALYVPTSKVRLLSTTKLLSVYCPGETISINQYCLTLSGNPNYPNRRAVIARIDPTNQLPSTITYNQLSSNKAIKKKLCNIMTTVSANNNNLSASEKELLRWHFRLGHLAFKKVQHLMRSGVLAGSESTRSLHVSASKMVQAPRCAACLFAKQTVLPTKGVKHQAVKDTAGILKRDNLLPGKEVSVDHFVCSTKGRLFSGFDRGSDD